MNTNLMTMNKSLRIKLKFLGLISTKQVDFRPIIKDSISYNRWKFWKIFSLIKFIKQITAEINFIRQQDFKNTIVSDNCPIKRPIDIDHIPFIAMIELQQLFGNTDSDSIPIEQLISKSIAIVCFSSNNKEDYDSDSIEFKKFHERILEEDLIEMMSVFKWIEKILDESSSAWEINFFEVEIEDRDYEAAGGSRMNQFNVLMTIKNTCTDFNIPYKDALLMPYGMTQANSLSKATQAHVQDTMSKIIEARMKQERARIP